MRPLGRLIALERLGRVDVAERRVARHEVAGDRDEVAEDVIGVEREGRVFRYAQYSLALPSDAERMAP